MKWIMMTVILVLSILFHGLGQVPVSYLRSVSTMSPLPVERLSGFNHLPIRVDRDQLLIPGQIEGVTGYFILDTGAPSLVVHRKWITKKGMPISGKAINGEQVQLEEVSDVRVKFRNNALEKYDVLVTDLSHLVEGRSMRILGLLGKDWLDDSPFVIDLKRNILTFLNDTRVIERRKEVHVSVSEIQFIDHLPVLSVLIQGKPYHLGLDLGSSRNILKPQVINNISKEGYQVVAEIELQGLSATVQRCQLVDISNVKLTNSDQNRSKSIEFIIAPLPRLSTTEGTYLDGLIGMEALSELVFSIDYDRKMILWWDLP